MRTGAIFARGSCRALKWMALFGLVFAVGVGQAAAQEDGKELELTIKSVSIGGSTADKVTVNENSVVEVVVTLNEKLPVNPDDDATGTVLTLPINVTASDILAVASAAKGMAEEGDVQIDGTDLTTTARTALRTFDEGDNSVSFRIELDQDPDAVNEKFTLTVALGALAGGNGTATGNPDQTEVSIEQVDGANVTKAVEITIDDDETQTYDIRVTTAAANRLEGNPVAGELVLNPPRPPAEPVTLYLFLSEDGDSYEIVDDGDAATDPQVFKFNNDANSANDGTGTQDIIESALDFSIDLKDADGDGTADDVDGDRDPDMVTLMAQEQDADDRRVFHDRAEEMITVADVHALPAMDKITAKAYMDDDGDKDDDAEAMSVMEGGDPVHVTVTIDRGDDGYPKDEPLEVTLMADASQGLDFRFPDGSNKVTIPAGDDEQSADIKLLALKDEDVGPEDLVLSLMVEGTDDDNGPGSVMGTPFSIAIEDATDALVSAKDDWQMAVTTAMGGDPEGDPPHTLSPGDSFMLMGTDLFEAGETPVDITYSASVEGDAASVTVSGDTLTVTASMVPDAAMSKVTITATAERSASSFGVTQTISNVASIFFPVNVDLATLSVDVTAVPDAIDEGGESEITATASRNVETGDGEVTINLVVGGDATLEAESITIPVGSMSASVTLTATEDDEDYEDETVTVAYSGTGVTGQGQLSISVTDNDTAPEPPVVEPTVKAVADAQSVFDAEVGSDFVKGGADVSFDAGMLFEEFGADVDPVFAVTSSDDMVVGAAVSGNMLMLTPAGYGSATVSVTVTDRTSEDTATASGMVMVGLADVSVMVAAADMTIDEGGSTMITATASRMLEGDEMAMVNLTVVGDGTLDADSITIEAGSNSGSVTLMSTDDDVHEPDGETVTVAYSGTGIDGTQQIVITVMDNDDAPEPPVVEPTVTAKDNAAQMILDAVAMAAGDADWMVGGMVATVDMADLFNSAEGASIAYSGASSTEAVMAGTSGTMLMLTPMAEGVSTITVTASDSASMDVARVDADVAVALQTLSIGVAASADTVKEGESVTLTATANRAVTAETMLTVTVTGDMAAVEADAMITIAMGQMTGTGMVMAVEDDDSADAMVSVVVSGAGIAGGAASFDVAITDNDPTVTAKDAAVVQALFGAATAMAGGTGGWVPGAAAATVDMSELFTTNDSPTLEYMAESSAEDMVAASASGSMLTLTPMATGDATISVTATDTGGDMYDTATVSATVMVGVLPLEITVAPPTAEVEEGGMVEIMATANKMVDANVEVMLIRDAASSASEDDYSLEPALITIMAGEAMGKATLTATDDYMVEGNESLSLVARVKDMGDIGSVMVSIMDNDMETTYTLSGPMDMNIVEGMDYELTATANQAVRMDTEVMLMRDRAASDAGDDDYTVSSIMIMAGEMSGTTMLMVTEDNMPDAGTGTNMGESLVLIGSVDGMEIGSLEFTIWDAAVPALPIIAQLLLAGLLAIGGYRRFRRR